MVDKELDSHLKLEIIEDYVSYLTDYDLKKMIIMGENELARRQQRDISKESE